MLEAVRAHGFEHVEGRDGVLLEVFSRVLGAETNIRIRREMKHRVRAFESAFDDLRIAVRTDDYVDLLALRALVRGAPGRVRRGVAERQARAHEPHRSRGGAGRCTPLTPGTSRMHTTLDSSLLRERFGLAVPDALSVVETVIGSAKAKA